MRACERDQSASYLYTVGSGPSRRAPVASRSVMLDTSPRAEAMARGTILVEGRGRFTSTLLS